MTDFFCTELKELQETYNRLVTGIQSIFESHVQRHVRETPSPLPRTTSPSFFANLSTKARPKTRARSNTNPTPSQIYSSNSPSMQDVTTAQLAFKEMASAFYTINSKYRISWECAGLLIELGGGSTQLLLLPFWCPTQCLEHHTQPAKELVITCLAVHAHREFAKQSCDNEARNRPPSPNPFCPTSRGTGLAPSTTCQRNLNTSRTTSSLVSPAPTKVYPQRTAHYPFFDLLAPRIMRYP